MEQTSNPVDIGAINEKNRARERICKHPHDGDQ